ncbi:DnaC-like helicase loader [Bacillus phage BCD7]|uniref:Putative DNA replication protein DnaC n=1 Tax=Bacillus phage BCD7 TaxID=1136534 RepID=J9PV77_9CAUD|nr:DnaC-like helicase loader [Bacillus phage BCD7]AEZ50509.1 putative DNA replication protein DnaC [Bacillus phage BCD7]
MSRPKRSKLSKENLAYRGVPRDYFDATLEQYPIDASKKKLVKNFINNFPEMLADGQSLIMYGSNGSGKTYLSAIIVKEAYRYRYSSFLITLQSLIDLKFKSNRDEDAREKIQKIYDAEFLVIDEVGKETFSEKLFNVTLLEELLRYRDTKGTSTIICTNLPLDTKDGLYEQYGKSISSLIKGNFVKLKYTEEDNRTSVTRQKKSIKLLFGE